MKAVAVQKKKNAMKIKVIILNIKITYYAFDTSKKMLHLENS